VVGEVGEVVILERLPEGVNPGIILAPSRMTREQIATLIS